MADAPEPVDAFAPPDGPPERPIPLREVSAFVIERTVRIAMGPVTLLLAASLLGLRDHASLASAAALGTAMWLPTSSLLFRVMFFPSPPDPGLLDSTGRGASARDLRVLVRSHFAEHLLGSLPLWLLIAATRRLLDPRLATATIVAGTAFVGWRALRAATHLMVQEADLDVAVGREDRAASRLGFLSALWMPGFGDAAWAVLARARFRGGDPAGAVRALDHLRSRDWRVEGLRAQMGVAVLPRVEVEAICDRLAAGPPEQASVALVIDALLRLETDRPLEPRHTEHLAGLPEGELRRVGAMLLAADAAARDPEGAAGLLRAAGVDPDRVVRMRANWPTVAARIGPLFRGGAGGGVR